MFFLLSGEGVTDMGVAKNHTTVCEGKDFQAGPMAIIGKATMTESFPGSTWRALRLVGR
jgi:hypothetical protein